MTSIAKRQKLHQYIEGIANNHDIDVLLDYIESDMKPEVAYNKWDDADFVAEMERRAKSLEDGTDKGHTWEEVKANARKAVKSGNSK
jgi:putative addiction module component (TIGR02574 family)